MVEKKISDGTVIRISQELRDELQKTKLVPNETHDHQLKRIIKENKKAQRGLKNRE